MGQTREQRKAMFAKLGLTPRTGRLSESFEDTIENEIRKALAEKFQGVRKTKEGDIRVGFDNLDHIDISIKKKSGKDSSKPFQTLLDAKIQKTDSKFELK